MSKVRIAAALAMLAHLLPVAAQRSAPPPRFAVVSIIPHGPTFRLSRAGPDQPGPVFPGGKYIDHQAELYELMWFAYPDATVPNQTLIGLPRWAYSVQASFDLEAEALPGTSPSLHQMRTMMRQVLADRFKLRFHTATRLLPVYFLELAKGGPHGITPAKPDETGAAVRLAIGGGTFAVHAHAARIRDFATKLGAYVLNRPVIDRTGLTGFYDIDVVRHSPRPPGAGRGWMRGIILRGLRSGLGLTLISGNAPVPVMVVDRVERPTPN